MSFACPHCGKAIHVSAEYEYINGSGSEDDSIEALLLSVRPYCALKNHNIRTISQLTALADREMLAWPNFGKVSLREVKLALLERNLALKP